MSPSGLASLWRFASAPPEHHGRRSAAAPSRYRLIHFNGE